MYVCMYDESVKKNKPIFQYRLARVTIILLRLLKQRKINAKIRIQNWCAVKKISRILEEVSIKKRSLGQAYPGIWFVYLTYIKCMHDFGISQMRGIIVDDRSCVFVSALHCIHLSACKVRTNGPIRIHVRVNMKKKQTKTTDHNEPTYEWRMQHTHKINVRNKKDICCFFQFISLKKLIRWNQHLYFSSFIKSPTKIDSKNNMFIPYSMRILLIVNEAYCIPIRETSLCIILYLFVGFFFFCRFRSAFAGWLGRYYWECAK